MRFRSSALTKFTFSNVVEFFDAGLAHPRTKPAPASARPRHRVSITPIRCRGTHATGRPGTSRRGSN